MVRNRFTKDRIAADRRPTDGMDRKPTDYIRAASAPGLRKFNPKSTLLQTGNARLFSGIVKQTDVGHIGSVDKKSVHICEVSKYPGWERIRVQVDSGAIDTVAPKEVAAAFNIFETAASKKGMGFVAANGTKIKNYGEKRVIGYTDDGEGVSLKMQCADVRKTLGSVHKMNQGGNVVVLDGNQSYMVNKKTMQKTRIQYEDGQYVFSIWVPSKRSEVPAAEKTVLQGNRYSVLAMEEEESDMDFIGQDLR